MFRLLACLSLGLCLSAPAFAQTSPDAGTAAAPAAGAAKKPATTKKTSTATKKKRKKKGAPATTETTTAPAPTVVHIAPSAQPPAQQPSPEPDAYNGPPDDDPPTLTHTPIAKAMKGKPLTVIAHATDLSGLYGPFVFLRKRGLPATDFIALKMTPVTTRPGDFKVDVSSTLTNVDALDYYVEVYDIAGNGPVRVGSPENPLQLALEEEKKPEAPVVAPPPPPTNVTVHEKGAPPAINHTAVTQATKGTAIEINARLVGDTGVGNAIVLFRHAGEKDYKTLPMGNIGGDNYTATVPAAMATSDIEYYLEATDRFGNGPGRSGAPNVPYVIHIAEPVIGATVIQHGADQHQGPRIVKAPFSPNPGRAFGWLAMAGFVGGLVFAGGEALAASSANTAYTHTYTYEGRNETDLLAKANTDGKRAKTALIVSGSSLVAGIVLLIVFPEHADTMVVGSGGDVGVKF